jgi:DNA-binding ferritin-like protein (Dps family)
MLEHKRKYKQMIARADALPEDCRFVFKKIQTHMWQFAAGLGMDMLNVQADLLDLFGEGEGGGGEVAGVCLKSWVMMLQRSARSY